MSSRWSLRSLVPFVSGQRHFAKLGTVHFDPRATREVEFIYNEIFTHRDYLATQPPLPPGAVLFDVGANIGLFTLYAARHLTTDGTIYAFEPIPRTFGYLERNIAEHDLGARVRTFNTGLGRAGGPSTLVFTHYPHLPGNSTVDVASKQRQFDQVVASVERTYPILAKVASPILRQQMATTEQVECAMRPLADVIRAERVARVDLLKIDVEGAELDVLAGLDDQTWPLIERTVIETNENGHDAVAAVLRERGLTDVVIERPRFVDAISVDNHVVHARRPR